jgi:hypothetical protein
VGDNTNDDSAEGNEDPEAYSRTSVWYGLTYAAVGLTLVVLSYVADGWARWPLGIVGWLLLLAGSWTLLFTLVILRVLAKSIEKMRTRQ